MPAKFPRLRTGRPCAGGCGLAARADGPYHPHHHPKNGGCPPLKKCICPCGQFFQPAKPSAKYIKGHHKRKPDKHCTECGAKVPLKNQSGLCQDCYHATLKGPLSPLQQWARDNDATYRAISAANGRKGWKKQGVKRETVVAVLKSKGIKPNQLAFDLGISREYARALMNVGRHYYMRRPMAERLLRYAAGLPFEPTKQQRVAAERKDFAWRRRISPDRGGPGVNRKPDVFKPVTRAELKATAHLAKKRSAPRMLPRGV